MPAREVSGITTGKTVFFLIKNRTKDVLGSDIGCLVAGFMIGGLENSTPLDRSETTRGYTTYAMAGDNRLQMPIRKNTQMNKQSIPATRRSVSSGSFRRLHTTLWPNGEIVISKPRKKQERRYTDDDLTSLHIHTAAQAAAVWPILGACLLRMPVRGHVSLGLFPLTNSDRITKAPTRYGLRGITTKGRRTVRNACYLLQRDYGDRHLTFSTVTLPDLSVEDMEVLHEGWHHIVELYRLKMRRKLQDAGLPGLICGVTEIQEKRWKNSGAPVLHCHFVFVGRKRGSGWAVSTQEHDVLWSEAISTVLGRPIGNVHAAAQLKRVDGLPDTYLGKYVSKGAASVERVKQSGLTNWLPRQWWNCSLRLVRKIAAETKKFTKGSELLMDMVDDSGAQIWAWYRDFNVDFEDGETVFMARYGCLTPLGRALAKNTFP